MRALVAHGPGDFRLEDRPWPEPERGAVIEVEGAGVCASDRMIWRGDGPWDLAFPFVPGHEWVGRVRWVDPDSARRWGVRAGDRVTAEVMVPCGECQCCRARRTHLCRTGRHLGSALPGAFAQAMAVPPEAVVHKVPDSLDPAAAVLIEPTACAVHALNRAGLVSHDVVAVSGVGAIGAAALGVAAGRGARVLAVANTRERAALALELGAAEAVDASSGDPVARLMELTGGVGVDAFVECSGSTRAVEVALRSTAPGGRVVLYGVYREKAKLDLNIVAERKELDIRGAHLAPHAFPEAIAALASGDVVAERIVTHRHRLEDARSALEPDPAHGRLKAVLVPGGRQ